MKIFMSWSGLRSKLTAELLHDWIKCVIQAAQPWISSKGIERGALWFSEINNELKDTTIGVICITQENKNAPWILFEAGALAKGLATNRVCTFLIDLDSNELQPPLAQFNHTFPNQESIWTLVMTLNNGLESNRLEPHVLRRVFDTYWPQFQTSFAKIIEDNPPVTVIEPRDERDILSEILDTTRNMAGRIRNLEARLPPLKTISLSNSFRTAANRIEETGPLNMPDEHFTAAVNLAAMYLHTGMSAEYVQEKIQDEIGIGKRASKHIVEVAVLTGSNRGNEPN